MDKYERFLSWRNYDTFITKIVNNIIRTKSYADWELPIVNRHPKYENEQDISLLAVGPCIDEHKDLLIRNDPVFQKLLGIDQHLKNFEFTLYERQQIGRVALRMINRSMTEKEYNSILNEEHPIMRIHKKFSVEETLEI